jgi:hypothetical protein
MPKLPSLSDLGTNFLLIFVFVGSGCWRIDGTFLSDIDQADGFLAQSHAHPSGAPQLGLHHLPGLQHAGWRQPPQTGQGRDRS